MNWMFCIFLLQSVVLLTVGQQQRVAPGVPPQQYHAPGQQVHQQQVHQQQVHQQQVHQQQIHQQQHLPVQQHVPVQQIPVQQVPVQQVPMQQQLPVQQVPMQQQLPVQQVPMQQVPVQQVPIQQVPVPVQQIPIQQVPVQHIPVQHAGHGQPILSAANMAHEKEHIQEHLDVPIDTSKMSEQELQFHYFKMHDADNNNKLDGCELIKSLIHWHEQGHKDPNTPTVQKTFNDEELVQLIDPILNMDDGNNDGFIDYPEFVRAQQKAAASAAAGTGGAGARS